MSDPQFENKLIRMLSTFFAFAFCLYMFLKFMFD